jgi:integral membrane sensor domain MASE1
VGLGVFAVVGAFVDAETGAIVGVVALLITIMAMRTEQWNQLVAKAAAYLQPPKD